MAGLAQQIRATLTAWRDLCLDLPDTFAERIRYGMLCYQHDGPAEQAFAALKRYLSLYVARTDVVDAHHLRFDGFSVGKGCVRLP